MKTKKNVLILRVPEELKTRIERVAESQGVSLNQFALYALTKELGELEANSYLRRFLREKGKDEIYAAFDAAMTSCWGTTSIRSYRGTSPGLATGPTWRRKRRISTISSIQP